jgi:excisionase family DNA binding protein
MLLTIPQAANQLDLSRQRVWLLVTRGRIKAQRIGQVWLINERELVRFSGKRSNGSRPPRKDAGK